MADVASPPFEAMFHHSHIDTRRGGPLSLVLLALYTPIGLSLFCLRAIVFLAITAAGGAALLAIGLLRGPSAEKYPSSPLSPGAWRLLLRVFGVRVRITDEGDGDNTNTREGVKNVYKGFESQADTATVLVCNHVTAFDVLPLLAVVSGASVLIDAEFFRAVSPVWHRAVGAILLDRTLPRDVSRRSITEHLCGGRTLVVFPEGWDTSGTHLLRFNRFVFGIGGVAIQCAGLRARVLGSPWLPIVPGKLGSSVARELAWLFFVPGVEYRVTMVGGPKGTNLADPAALAAECQREIARATGAVPTGHSNRDVHAWRAARGHGRHHHGKGQEQRLKQQ